LLSIWRPCGSENYGFYDNASAKSRVINVRCARRERVVGATADASINKFGPFKANLRRDLRCPQITIQKILELPRKKQAKTKVGKEIQRRKTPLEDDP
jgi:ABC-type transporter Mla subunit MlaD